MTSLTIIIATPNARAGASVGNTLADVPDFKVAGIVSDLTQLMRRIETAPPDIVLLSEKYASFAEFDLVISLMADLDVRWFALAGRSETGPAGYDRRVMADIFEFDASTPADALARQIRTVCRNKRSPVSGAEAVPGPASQAQTNQVVLIGGSTGGVDCLIRILENYGPQSPPTLIVQHTGAGFQPSLIKLLNRRTSALVIAGEDGVHLRNGMVAVAASSDVHLQLAPSRPFRCMTRVAPPHSGHRPSVDVLFESGVPHARLVTAALLTGMGSDGAAGLKALRDAGATTVAQDQSSCVVWGMPRVAHEMGAVQKLMDINAIAEFLPIRTIDSQRQDRTSI